MSKTAALTEVPPGADAPLPHWYAIGRFFAVLKMHGKTECAGNGFLL